MKKANHNQSIVINRINQLVVNISFAKNESKSQLEEYNSSGNISCCKYQFCKERNGACGILECL
ncbi:hypothetical protein [Pedobacter alpinus]|uniref:hypothetical protein n=1 Tax=Pedobacter alpinus TaxID=1590643 RepID=UPI003671FF11